MKKAGARTLLVTYRYHRVDQFHPIHTTSEGEESVSNIPSDIVVGIDLGGTKVLIGLVGPDNSVLSRYKAPTREHHQPDELLKAIAAGVHEAAKKANVPWEAIRAAGMGIPGPIDAATGVVKLAPNLGWSNVPVREVLERELGLPVGIDNDVRVATLSEFQLGAGRGHQRVVSFFVGTGIGGGLVLDGQVYHGAHNAAGEIGHTFVKAGGPLCSAGHKGCLEAMASRTAIQRDIVAAAKKGKATALKNIAGKDLAEIKSGDLAEALERNDKLTKRVVRRAAHYVGYGIASAVNLLDPEIIILGGGVVEALGDTFMNWAIERARPNIIASDARAVAIIRAELGDDAGMLGAALVARSVLTHS